MQTASSIRRMAGQVAYPGAALLLFLLAWQAVVAAQFIPEEYLPGPAQALRALTEMLRSGDLCQ